LGVHAFGTGADELVHIGRAVMTCGGTVFNHPSLLGAYKVAALDVVNKTRAASRFGG
jgi:NAD(P) transhydrogenase